MAVTLNANTSTGFIATSDTSGVLQLQTGGTAAVTVDASQQVGIGTASPSYKLDVSGNVSWLPGVTGAPRGYLSGASADQSIEVGSSTNSPFGIATNAVRRMTIDSSGNVGIGTTSPVTQMHLYKASGTVTYTTQSGSNYGYFGNDGNYIYLATNVGATGVKFRVSMAAPDNAATIDSSGNLLVGTTSSNGKLTVNSASTNAGLFYVSGTSLLSTPASYFEKADNNTTTSNIFVRFTINSQATGSGQINANGASAAAFGSFSDSRLKENIVDLPSQLDNIMALRTVEFDYIESEGGGHQIGFIAQEVQEIYPDLVGEREDGMLTLTDLNKNDARLIKAIQEMKAIIDTQASTITSLTDRITALEGTTP